MKAKAEEKKRKEETKETKKKKQEKEGEEWIECDYCGEWFHVQCTDLPVLDALNTLVDYTCEQCEVEGFPSHNDD